jgi:hypothetical protein
VFLGGGSPSAHKFSKRKTQLLIRPSIATHIIHDVVIGKEVRNLLTLTLETIFYTNEMEGISADGSWLEIRRGDPCCLAESNIWRRKCRAGKDETFEWRM